MTRIAYRARWMVPVGAPPIENGRLEVIDGRIAAVGRAVGPVGTDVDLGDAAVLPGFVNAHTHLELTHCRGRIPYRGAFADWVRDLVSLRGPETAGPEAAPLEQGMRESLTAGVTALADIGHGRAAAELWRTSPLCVAGFLEVLGMGRRRGESHHRSLAGAVQVCEDFAGFGGNSGRSAEAPVRIGLTPHAPYSTDPALYGEAIAYCRCTGRPICTHLAETPEESRFLADGTGPFRELLEEWDLWDGSFEPPRCSPIEYARGLGLLDCRPLLAHVNYVGDADLDLLAGSGANVAFCPRTHRFFRHRPHRYRDMLARGINVCIGTDSLACTDSLSVLDELRFLRRADPFVSDERLLNMGTLAGATALGLDRVLGSLEPGKRADLAIVALEHPTGAEPLRDVLNGTALPGVYLAGLHTPSREGA